MVGPCFGGVVLTTWIRVTLCVVVRYDHGVFLRERQRASRVDIAVSFRWCRCCCCWQCRRCCFCFSSSLLSSLLSPCSLRIFRTLCGLVSCCSVYGVGVSVVMLLSVLSVCWWWTWWSLCYCSKQSSGVSDGIHCTSASGFLISSATRTHQYQLQSVECSVV
jgi:hypothetical protein